MTFQDVFSDLRRQAGLSQNEVADRLFVTRQAVSRWERGETVPEVETLQALSKLFGVSINTLLGSPRPLVCQSCGMPLSDDELLAREADGTFQEKYCKWCWNGGDFATDCTMEEMVEQCLPFMPLTASDPEASRAYLRSLLPTLERWKQPD
ncbi:zinc ribbon domain-containing protein [uncultured Oscillibacter sp.]|uniref:zinc ribbon domain-containing protein n=1 Tax=uncultured Oscillibacter sp. TaxID=876091 RepID=UPI00280659CF|nr:zinc ribbon domain-containing protein [uncultured Oscillibacter sp.]